MTEHKENKETVIDAELARNSEILFVTEHNGGKQGSHIRHKIATICDGRHIM